MFRLLFNALLRGILLKSQNPQKYVKTAYFALGWQITQFCPKHALKPFKFRLIGQVFGKCTPHNADIEERPGKVYYLLLILTNLWYNCFVSLSKCLVV